MLALTDHGSPSVLDCASYLERATRILKDKAVFPKASTAKTEKIYEFFKNDKQCDVA